MNTSLTTTFVADVLKKSGGSVHSFHRGDIKGGVADSRKVKGGELFAAFRGEHLDGNDYVKEALEAGAKAIICEQAPEGNWPDQTIITVQDTRQALLKLAQSWRKACDPFVIGITGTVGKTTTKELTAEVLQKRFKTHHSPGNFNSKEGLPLALLSLTSEMEVSVLEMGMDSPGEIATLCQVAEPQCGVVLNIGTTHLEKLGTMEAITREKLSLVKSLDIAATAILNIDDLRIEPVIKELSCNVITFGSNEKAMLKHGPVKNLGLDGSRFSVNWLGQEAHVRLRMPGIHLVHNALAAIGVQIVLGTELEYAARAISETNASSRMKIRHGKNGIILLDDTYNASPLSVAGALGFLKDLQGRRIAFLGEMAELGTQSDIEHRRIGTISAKSCDLLYLVGERCQLIFEEAKQTGHKDVYWFNNKESALQALLKELTSGDIILLKGSRSEELESLIPKLEAKI